MIEKKELSAYKKRYHSVRHHAWAGSVFLAILLAVRLIVEISDIYFEHIDTVVLLFGSIIIIYTLIALYYTYKYRSGLSEEKVIQMQFTSKELEQEKMLQFVHDVFEIMVGPNAHDSEYDYDEILRRIRLNSLDSKYLRAYYKDQEIHGGSR